MKLFKIVCTLCLCLFVYSCTSSTEQSNMNQSTKTGTTVSLKPWIGKPISEVINHPKFGVPDSKETVGTDTIATYKQLFSAAGHVSDDSLTVNLFCRRSFVYDKSFIIKNVLEEGNCQNSKELLPIENAKK